MDEDGNDADSLPKVPSPPSISQSTPVKVKRKRRSIDITIATRQVKHANGPAHPGEEVQKSEEKKIIKGEEVHDNPPSTNDRTTQRPASGVPLPRRKMKVNRRTNPCNEPGADGRPPFSPSSNASAVRSADNTPLTPEELDRAKSIVLDLLGWGVPPEYLIERGVSPHAIYHIFTELQLRLPSNLSLPY